MKFLRCLVVIALACGCAGIAKADAIDFHMNVLDPPPAPSDPSYPLYLITTTSFSVSFTACLPGELPNGMTADGCFAGRNVSGQDWDNLQLTFVSGGVLTGQTADCAAAPSDNIFTDADCPESPENGLYTLTFSGGDGIPGEGNSNYFFITEDGVTPATNFPTGSAQVLTPEPGSIVLLSTGILLFAWLLYGDRVRLLRASPLS